MLAFRHPLQLTKSRKVPAFTNNVYILNEYLTKLYSKKSLVRSSLVLSKISLWCAFFDNNTAIHKDNDQPLHKAKPISWVTIAIVIPDLARSRKLQELHQPFLGQGLMLVRQTREHLDP